MIFILGWERSMHGDKRRDNFHKKRLKQREVCRWLTTINSNFKLFLLFAFAFVFASSDPFCGEGTP